MSALIESHLAETSGRCRHFYVRRLDLSGSAARGIDFNADSDFDFLVSYESNHTPSALGDFLDFRDGLSLLLGRRADLTMESALRNPFVRSAIERSRQPLFGA